MKRIDRSSKVRTGFHQAKWDEPIIYELSTPGERGILVGEPDKEIAKEVEGAAAIPAGMARSTKLNLPEMSQSRVLRHYSRLAQQTLGADVNIEIGQGTCTMKYSPKVNDQLANLIREYHPLQDPDTVQGILKIFHETDKYMCEISGMDHFTFQPSGGSQGILTMASVIRAYFKDKGEDRDEIITTIYSHPSDAAAPHVAGFKIIYLQPDPETGVPDLEQLKAACGPKTAGYIVANPEDTGVYNSHVKEFVDYVHSIGGLCAYDQANANGLLGVTRARDAGFDICFFNLHKTFSTPHGGGGPGSGPVGCKEMLSDFLPSYLVEGEETLHLEKPANSIGEMKSFYGNFLVVVKALTYIKTLGREGIPEASQNAVLNANYMMNKLKDLYLMAYDEICMHEFVMSLADLKKKTGISAMDIAKGLLDDGIHPPTMYFPLIVDEALMVEPTETESKETLDDAIAVFRKLYKLAETDPEKLYQAPVTTPVTRLDEVNAARHPHLRYVF